MSEEAPETAIPADIPETIKVSAYILLLITAVVGIVLAILSFTTPPSEVIMENPLNGHQYLAGSMVIRVAGSLLVLALCSLGVLLSIFILKGRMWAYYLALVSFVCGMFGETPFPPFHIVSVFHVNIVNALLIIMFAVNYKGYRKFAEYRQHQPRRSAA